MLRRCYFKFPQKWCESMRKRKPSRRRKVVLANRAASAMASVEELGAALGIGKNCAYGLVQAGLVTSVRFGRRYLIPRTVIAQIVAGETPAAVKRCPAPGAEPAPTP
jgi:excisionase family DNA binding protein